MIDALRHERILITKGARSQLPIVIAVHSTALGQAVGGCRMWNYESWQDGMVDALRLSEAMTLKSALANLPLGGGKSVIALPPGRLLDDAGRHAVMLDLGDAVESLNGVYEVAEDVGTTAEDMLVASGRTRFAHCLPVANGGSGETSEPTALGVYAGIKATCEQLYGTASPAGLRFTVIGLGQTGSRLAKLLRKGGAELVVTDIDPSKRALAEELGAKWVSVEEALAEPVDILVPAALGGLLTEEVAQEIQCRAIIGPANNQLAGDGVADILARRGILWAPDFLVNAGGVIFGGLVEGFGADPDEAMVRVEAIGSTLRDIYQTAAAHGTTPHAAALELARQRVEEAGRNR